jgi:hypothetical protein
VVAEIEEDSVVMAADASVEKGTKRTLDVTPFLNKLQTDAAAQLGIPVSSLSKRWKEASKGLIAMCLRLMCKSRSCYLRCLTRTLMPGKCQLT